MALSPALGLLPDQVQRPQPYPRSRSHPYALCMDSLAAAYTHSAIYRHDCTHTSARAHTHKHTQTHTHTRVSYESHWARELLLLLRKIGNR